MMLLALLLVASSPSAADPCPYDHDILKVGIDAFDQDLAGGWRPLSEKPACAAEAANVIRFYREHVEARTFLLYWHEAQLRAELNDYGAAILLMDRSRRPPGPANAAWNAYVDATMAFLRRDRSSLLTARAQLAALPKPFDWPVGADWPMNGAVVDGLLRCFNRPYKEAYGQSCRD